MSRNVCLGLLLASLVACRAHVSTGLHPASAPGVLVVLQQGGDSVDLLNNNFAEAPYATGNARVKVLPAGPGTLNVTVRDIASDGTTRILDCKPAPSSCVEGGGFEYDLGKSFDDLHNADQLHFVVTKTEGGQQSAPVGEYAVNFRQRLSGTGLVVPVLYVVQGSAAEFGVKNIAPSSGLGVQYNLESKRFPYFAVEVLYSLNPNAKPSTAADKPYSSGLGGVVDFGGWAQAGASYRTQDKRWSAIFALRESLWSRLTGK